MKRFIRSFFAIVILTAFVVGISFFIKNLAIVDANKVVEISKKAASKIGVDEDQFGDVAGAFVKRVTDLGKGKDAKAPAPKKTPVEKNPIYSVAIMADAHNDFVSLQKAVDVAVERKVKAIFFLGDFTNWGDEGSFVKARDILIASRIDYYALPGDHDLAKSVGDGDISGLAIYKKVFGDNFHSVKLDKHKFVLFDNSANFSLIGNELMTWFDDEVADANFILLSQPLWHPGIPRYMGNIDGTVTQSVKAQGDVLLIAIRNSKVQAIIAGDQHFSSRSVDDVKPGLKHFVVGALTSENNLQTARFAILTLYDDSSYDLEDVNL